MSLINSLFGEGAANIWTVALALVFVLVLIVFLVWVLKFVLSATRTVGLGRNRRIAITDSVLIDAKRHLILVRRDDVEHLILTGGTNDLVVETSIPMPAISEAKSGRSAAATRRSSLSLGVLTRERGTPPGLAKNPPEVKPATARPGKSRPPLAPGLLRREPVAGPTPPDAPTSPELASPVKHSGVKSETARPSTGMSALEKLREMARARTPQHDASEQTTQTRGPGILRPVTRHQAAPAPPEPNKSGNAGSDSGMSGRDAPVRPQNSQSAPSSAPGPEPEGTPAPGAPDTSDGPAKPEKAAKTDPGEPQTVPDPADWQSANRNPADQAGTKAR